MGMKYINVFSHFNWHYREPNAILVCRLIVQAIFMCTYIYICTFKITILCYRELKTVWCGNTETVWIYSEQKIQ